MLFMLFIKKFQICQGSFCSSVNITLAWKPLLHKSSYTSIISLSIAKRDEYPCHAKQWPTPTSIFGCYSVDYIHCGLTACRAILYPNHEISPKFGPHFIICPYKLDPNQTFTLWQRVGL